MKFAIISAIALFIALAKVATAAVVSDSFAAGATETSINGLAPDTANLPGGTWSVGSNNLDFYAWTDTPNFGGPAKSLFFWAPHTHVGGAATITLSSTGSYTKPTQFTIQVDVLCTNIGTGVGGAMLGFYSSPSNPASSGVDPITGFTGLMMDGAGNLTLVENGVAGTSVPYTGTFNPNVFNILSYTVNTATGQISNVSLGSNANYSFNSTAFTNSATNYGALGMRALNDDDTYGYAENFMVTASPSAPPATPAGLTAESGTGVGQIALSWSASTGAQDYIVQRSTLSSGGYSNIATVSTPAVAYTDNDLALIAGKNYYYEVAAANASGTSAFSGSAVATPYVPPTFAGWDYTWFGLTAPSSETSGTATPANDGLSNTLKYAVGLDPLTPDTFQPILGESGGIWEFTWQRPANRPDLLYVVQVSPDLVTWTSSGVTLTETGTGDPETWEAAYASGTPSKLFFRLQISGTATYPLTVNNGTGSGSYPAGAAVTVIANAPLSGYQFAEWTGATGALTSSTSATTTLTMPAAMTAITATYALTGSGGSVYLPNTATAPAGVYSQTKLISTYSGPAINVIRSTDGASMDIGFVGQVLDTTTATNFAGSGTLTVSEVYDQTGNGNNLTQPTVSLQPELFMTAGSAPVILVRQSQYLDIPSTLFANRQNFSSFMAARFPTNLRATPIFDFNNGTTFDFGWFSVFSNFLQEGLTGTSTETMGAARTLTSASPCIAGVVSNASGLTFHRDNFTATAAPVTSEMMSNGGQLMATHLPATDYIYGRCDMFSWVFYPAALSTADSTAVKAALRTLHNTNANTLTAHIFIQGDSITEGVGAPNNITIARALTDAIGDSSKMVRCFGKSGDEMEYDDYTWANLGSAYLEPGASNILVVWLGINDLNLGQTAAQLWANFGTYIGYARAAGWTKIVGVTLLPDGTSGWTAAQETQRQSFNAMVRANSSGYFDAIWDTDALTAAGQPLYGYTTNTNLSPDHLHPSEKGYLLLAPSLKAAVSVLY